MNDFLINMVASQLGLKPDVLAELKATKPKLIGAAIRGGSATLTCEVHMPTAIHSVVITLPVPLLKRLGPVYESAVKLANKS